MKCFFIPGRIPSLSLLEIISVSQTSDSSFTPFQTSGDAFFFEGSTSAIPSFFERLGGSIKAGVILESLSTLDDALPALKKILTQDADQTKRITFGLSAYTVSHQRKNGNRRDATNRMRELGLALKKELVADGWSARFVRPQEHERALSSVAVSKNNLLIENNKECCLFFDDSCIWVGSTSVVQAFENFSSRDWSRPNRDMSVGLLPPKLARIMINLSECKKTKTILDPFCGLGTIVQEALLLGYTNILGGDLEQTQIQSTRENLSWLHKKTDVSLDRVILRVCDAKNVARCFPGLPVDAIITEPTLGPVIRVRSTHIDPKTVRFLSMLYKESFIEWKKILPKGGRVVIVFPFWIFNHEKIFLPGVSDIQKQGYKNVTVPPALGQAIKEKTDRGSILIAREDQHVGRELFVFERI